MKTKLTYAEKITSILKAARIPVNVIALILALGKNNLAGIVFSANIAALTALPGIAEKRATVIIAALKKGLADARLSTKAEKREKAQGYSLKSFEKEELWRDLLPVIQEISMYRPQKDEDPAIRQKYIAKLDDLKKQLFSTKLTVRRKMGRIVRLNKSAISEVLGIEYENRTPTNSIVVVEHGIQELFNFSYVLFNNDKTIGNEMLMEFQKQIVRKLVVEGVTVLGNADSKIYGVIASSSSHQKQEKVLMVGAAELKAHQEFFWFGKALNDYATETKMLGAERLKATANLIRPWMKPFMTKDGQIIRMKDVLFVKDVERIYVIKNARRIGSLNGTLYQDGPDKESKVFGDGAIVSIVAIAFQGQCSSTGLKGFLCDGTSAVRALCKKHGITIEEFMDLQVEGLDGKLHRIGNYKAIAGEGCWKFDKAFESFYSYMEWLNRMASRYNGIDNLYLLRQAEEIEDEDKVRRLTKTLIQQWMYMDPAEIRKLTRTVRNDLQKAKSFSGSVKKLAALWKDPEDRTAVETLFNMAPWLVMNPIIQEYLKENWSRKVIEAASCKFRTQGQYPYIMQDPVALLEVWVMGLNPDSKDLGVLKGDEVSVADVPEGKELLCVRFPANFLTAMVMKNRACREEFDSLNGVMVISIYSDILIRQDGDVDGDEMCVIYDRLAIELTKRMNEKYNPPVVLFAHGSKAERHGYANAKEFLCDIADALWRAKRYDSVGIYANLAMKCVYLASVYEAQGDTKKRDQALLWMSAASTGAILAIDQVKGNSVDEQLINWIEDIQKAVRKAFREIASQLGFVGKEVYAKKNPFTHFYNEAAKRRPISMENCLPANPDNFVDQISEIILHTAGNWEKDYDKQGVVWSREAAIDALMDQSVPFGMTVKKGVVTQEMIDLLGSNWFKFAAKAGEIDETLATRRKMVVGSELGMKDFMILLWRNESSMVYSMEGRQLWEKKEEYYGVCRDLILMFLKSGNWINQYAKSYPVGYEFSMEERWAITANAVICDALELNAKNNWVEKKGGYAMFILKIFAGNIVENLRKNRVDNARFLLSDSMMKEIFENIEIEKATEDIELFEGASVNVPDEQDEMPDLPDEVLVDMLADDNTDDGWIPPMEEGFVPEGCPDF